MFRCSLKAVNSDQRRCLWTPPKEHSPFGIPFMGSAYLSRCKRCTNIISYIIKRVYERQRGKRSSWLSSKFRFIPVPSGSISIISHQNRKSKHKPKGSHLLFSITSSLFPFHCDCSSCVPRPSSRTTPPLQDRSGRRTSLSLCRGR